MLSVSLAMGQKNAIKNGYLQSDLDGNSKKLTNNAVVQSSYFAGGGGGLSNIVAEMAGVVTNGDLSINVDAFPQLDNSLRYSNQISVVIFGDSVGNYVWTSGPKLFDTYSTFPTAKGSLRYSGYSANGWGGWLNTLNSGVGSSVYDTVSDSWWGDGQIYVVSSGVSNVWSVGGTGSATGKLNGNLLKFWYFAAATNGTVVVETSTDGTTYVPRIIQNQATPSRGLICTNISLATADYYVRVSAGSGRCQYLWPQIVNTNTRAFHIANLCAGGKTMLEFMNMGTNNIARILTNMWPPPTIIAWVDTKSIFSYTNWHRVNGLFSTYSTNSDIVLGKPQPSILASIENDTGEGTYYQSLLFNTIGRTNKIPFFDMRSSFADTNRSARLNFYANDGSGVHFTANGQSALSDDFWTRLKILQRLTATTNLITTTSSSLTNAAVWNSMNMLDDGNGARHLHMTNAWSAVRMGLYFDTPSASGNNWAIAGDSSITGFKSAGGFYFFCVAGDTAGAHWQPSGALNIWGAGFAHADDDAGIGSLTLGGGLRVFGTSNYISSYLRIGDTLAATNGIIGTTVSGAAAAGRIGEVMESNVAIGSAKNFNSLTVTNVATLTLTAGDWDYEGNLTFLCGGVTAVFLKHQGSIGTTTATIKTDGTEANIIHVTEMANAPISLHVRKQNIVVTSPTTIYLVAGSDASAGTTVQVYGGLIAKRAR